MKAQKELERQRLGRKARRAGMVETIEWHLIVESLSAAPGIDWTKETVECETSLK